MKSSPLISLINTDEEKRISEISAISGFQFLWH